MRSAFCAHNFRSYHPERPIFNLLDLVARANLLVEPRPSGVTSKFHIGRKQFRPTSRTGVNAFLIMQVVLSCERPVGAFFSQDVKLLGSKDCLPFRFGPV